MPAEDASSLKTTSGVFKSSGIAVISFNFSSVLICPRQRPSSLAHALTARTFCSALAPHKSLRDLLIGVAAGHFALIHATSPFQPKQTRPEPSPITS